MEENDTAEEQKVPENAAEAKKAFSPVIVHCNAGIGRTGTLIALYNIIEALMYSKKYQK